MDPDLKGPRGQEDALDQRVMLEPKEWLVTLVHPVHLGRKDERDLQVNREKMEFPASVVQMEDQDRMGYQDLLVTRERKVIQEEEDHQDLQGIQDRLGDQVIRERLVSTAM